MTKQQTILIRGPAGNCGCRGGAGIGPSSCSAAGPNYYSK